MQDSKKQKLKNALRRICFFITLFAVLKLASFVFNPVRQHMAGQTSEDLRFYDALLEEENQIDILVLGNSESLTLVSTIDMWREKGYASYIGGQPGQIIPETYYSLKEILKTKKPKLVILETHGCISGGTDNDTYVAMRSGLEYCFPVLKYHSLWKPMITGANKEFPPCFNGFDIRLDVAPANPVPTVLPDEQTKFSCISKFYLDKIVSLCEKNDIKLLLVSAPSTTNYNAATHEEIARYAGDKGVPYIDFNCLYEEIGIDWNCDSLDGGDHINYWGSKKVTGYLMQYISDNYDIEDKRNMEEYSAWDEEIRAVLGAYGME